MGYLLDAENSFLNKRKLKARTRSKTNVFIVPEKFSLVDDPEAAFEFIASVMTALLLDHHDSIWIDYSKCQYLGIGAQALFDVILNDAIRYTNLRTEGGKKHLRTKSVNGTGLSNPNVVKKLWSVGSPAILRKTDVKFKDVEKYPLCIHNRDKHSDPGDLMAQKEVDTSAMVNYVARCLKRFDKYLTPEKKDDLAVVIGEVLINAEEHSSTQFRFSIGYFEEVGEGLDHRGVFTLAIFNFGDTIYRKFKNPDCQNVGAVESMEKLSKEYTTKKLFSSRAFEEETLWTLYALQDGVSSIAPVGGVSRGNGSMQFLERFSNLRGKGAVDEISRLSVFSGNTSIVFDGSYTINQQEKADGPFKVLTFNQAGTLEEPPDAKYVRFAPVYFPGTMISVRIQLTDDDLRDDDNS